MTDPQPRPDFDRRHHHVPYEELRRQLIEADEDRYRLQNELRAAARPPKRGWAAWTKFRRRAVIGAAFVVVTGLAGGVTWQMCTGTARADDLASVRVETATVVARIVPQQSAEPQPRAMKAGATLPAVRRVKATPVRNQIVANSRRARIVPRPLSPGEFGRARVAAY